MSDDFEVARWISVDERLPAEFERVLVWGGGRVSVASLGRHKRRWIVLDAGDGDVTHWMPIPAAPK